MAPHLGSGVVFTSSPDDFFLARQTLPMRGPTPAELRLWSALRKREPFWWREVQTDIWTLDFYCPAARLAVEVDGGYHEDQAVRERDAYRDIDNSGTGILTIRFTNVEVMTRRRHVVADIDRRVQDRTGQRVRNSWLSHRRAKRMRPHYQPEYDLRPARIPEPRHSAPPSASGADPAKALLERVRGASWASKRDQGPRDQ